MPSELLQELGVDSGLVKTAATALALLGVVSGGILAIVKSLAWLRRRLRRRIPEQRRRLRRRQLFASYVENRVRDLNRREEWSDYRFAELEAEVETVGDSRGRRLFRRRGLRHERSLSTALVKSRERLILLRGDPGSGKSVALRYVARNMATRAMSARDLDAVIPLYVNLKDLRTRGRQINAGLIEDFVLETVQRGGDREVHSFLDDEFAAGKAAGAWLFLFDSFDEIPEVLSSTEDDETVHAFSEAISEFVRGMHTCRGVIASRNFRAPQKQGLPTFRIVPLSEKRKLDLIAKADLGDAEPQLVAALRELPPELAALSANPLFLGLLIEYIKGEGVLPDGWHDVFEAFVTRRLETDHDRVMNLFGISAEDLRLRSEEVAFMMTDTDGFGLSPTRGALEAAYVEAGFQATADELDTALSALAWIKLARSDSDAANTNEETFTFAHRRFQEYFATCVVLREPDRVDAHTLLTDGRWRETAVTLCHAQPQETAAIVAEAEALLAASWTDSDGRPGDFEWSPGVLHLLGLLQSAFAGRTGRLPDGLRERIGAILYEATGRGTITDRKWALEVAGTAPADNMAGLLLRAFRGPSEWLREVAFRQVARLSEIPEAIATEIRRLLIEKTANGDLQRDWGAVRAQLLRLRPQQPFMRTALLLRIVPGVDALAFAVGLLIAVAALSPSLWECIAWGLAAAVVHLGYYPVAATISQLEGSDLEHSDVVPLQRRLEVHRGWDLVAVVAWPMRILAALLPLACALAPGVVESFGFTFGLIPVGDLGNDGDAGPALVWLYASSWSIVATFLVLREAPRIRFWPFMPLRLGWIYALRLRGISRARLRSGVVLGAFLVGVLGFFALYGVLLSKLPDTMALVVSAAVLLVIGVKALTPALRAVGSAVHDWRARRRWLSSGRTQMDALELLECLASMREATRATSALRDVRARQLMRDDPDAPLVLRDLLQAIELRVPTRKEIEPKWRSAAFASWVNNGNGPELARLSRFRRGVPDELGQLLEDVERDGEVPFA